MRIGIVAGETSGDLLGAGLVNAIRSRVPDATFRGITGPRMAAAGVETIFDAEELSVMGLVEVLGRLPRLLSIRRQLVADMNTWQPDVFVGIDSPDFTLPVERRMSDSGFKTVHYVSPTVWAWRPGRVRVVARAADAVLCLFPFEPRHYETVDIDARFVGHPLAASLAEFPGDRASARIAAGVVGDGPVVAVLPGSRGSELRHLGAVMADAMQILAGRGIQFVAPMVSHRIANEFRATCAQRAPEAHIHYLHGDPRTAMLSADVVLTASGTATLEAMLLSRPMVVAYRLAPLTAWLLRTFRMLQVDNFSIPNLLAGSALVPERLQEAATPANLAADVAQLLDDPQASARQLAGFADLREKLRGGGHAAAAEAVLGLAP